MHISQPLRSNIGKAVIKCPSTVAIKRLATTTVPATRLGKPNAYDISGPLGTTQFHLLPFCKLAFSAASANERLIHVSIADPTDKKQRAMWGTTRALLNNSILGVTEGFTVPVRFVGVGYRAQLDGDVLSLKLGYKDPIVLSVPSGVTVQVVNPTRLMLSGVDLQQMTQFAATIRKWRPPEPYNQKGVFVGTETIRKKVGKKK